LEENLLLKMRKISEHNAQKFRLKISYRYREIVKKPNQKSVNFGQIRTK